MWDSEMEHSFSKSKSSTLLQGGHSYGGVAMGTPPRGAHLPPAPPPHLRVRPLPPHFSLVDGVQVGAVTAALVLGVKAAIAHCRGGEGGVGGYSSLMNGVGGSDLSSKAAPEPPL